MDKRIKRPILIKEVPENKYVSDFYPGPGLYIIREEDGWWALISVHNDGAVDALVITQQEDLPSVFFDDEASEAETYKSTGQPMPLHELRNGRNETLTHSYNDVLRALAAASGTWEDKRI